MVACAKITNCLMDGKTAADFLAEINSTLAELRQKMDIIEEQLSCLLSRIEEEPESETLVSQMETPDVEEVPEMQEVPETTEDIPEVEETPEVAEDIPEMEEAPAATEDIPEVEEVPEVAEDIAEIDVQTEDIPVAMEDIPEIDDLPEEEEAPIMEIPVAADETPIDIGIDIPAAGEKAETEEVRVSINEAGERKLAKSVGDAASEKPRWRIDRPGSPVRNIISAISLNDRVLFIKTLFGEDPLVFQESISALNSMSTMEEAEAYIGDRFPDWKMSSDVVYRFMMAVRRKLG